MSEERNIGNSNSLAECFANAWNEDMEHSFDRLDGIYEGLLERIDFGNIYLPERDLSPDMIIRFSDEWDFVIREAQQSVEEYTSIARGIVGITIGAYHEANIERVEMPDNLLILQEWGYEIEIGTFVGLLYYHQRLHQLKHLLELYSNDITAEGMTSRHLFEMGLKRLGVEDGRYIGIVYDRNDERRYARSTADYLSYHASWINSSAPICWESNRNKAQAIRQLLFEHLKYAHLAYRGHPHKGSRRELLSPYTVHFTKHGCRNIKGRFHLKGNMNGFVGHRDDNTIIIGFSGTEFTSIKNWNTNIRQYLGRLDPVYVQAVGLLSAVWMGKQHKSGFSNSNILVCGHSLGGGLMQFAVGAMGKDEITGFGYNSAGLSMANVHDMMYPWGGNIFHLHRKGDFVFVLPFTTQMGMSVKCGSLPLDPCTAHLMRTIRKSAGAYKNDIALL